MDDLNPAVVRDLRFMASQGATASRLLREMIKQLAPDQPHKLLLIVHMRKIFNLSLKQANPIMGWAPDDCGELNDLWLDELVGPEIEKNRPEWSSTIT